MEVFFIVLAAGAVLVCGPVSLILAVRAMQLTAQLRRENHALRERVDALSRSAGHPGAGAGPAGPAQEAARPDGPSTGMAPVAGSQGAGAGTGPGAGTGAGAGTGPGAGLPGVGAGAGVGPGAGESSWTGPGAGASEASGAGAGFGPVAGEPAGAVPGRPSGTPPPLPSGPRVASASAARGAATGSAALPGAFEAVIGGQWLTWVGVLAIFFGTAFFLGYDLGESPFAGLGQILVGLAVAALFLAVGVRLGTGPRRFLGLGLMGGGIALLYLAAYAAYAFHGLIHVLAVYPFLLVVALVGSGLTLTRNSLAMAMLTLTGALLTPLLLQVSGDPGLLLFAYLVAVSLGASVTAAQRRWSALTLTAFLGTLLLVLLWWDAHHGASQPRVSLLGTGALWVLYLLAPLFTERRPGFWGAARSLVVAANGFLFAAVLLTLLGDRGNPERGAVLLGLAVVYLGVSNWASRYGPSPSGSLTHYTGIALLAAAAPVLLDAGWVSVTWVGLGIALHVAGVRLESVSHRILGWVMLALAAGKLMTWDTYTLLDRRLPAVPAANPEFASGLIVVGGILAAFFYLRRHEALLDRGERPLLRGSVLGAAVLLWFRLSTEIVAVYEYRHRDTGESFELATLLTLSLAWALYAAALVAVGFWTRFRPLRILGVLVLAVLVGKVFLLDMQELERGYRIASFVGVGILLLAVSLLYQRERTAASRTRG